jgi:hypothetical protein
VVGDPAAPALVICYNDGSMNGQKSFSPIIRVGMIVWGLLFSLGAPVSGYFLFRIFLQARANANWPAVPGLITHAGVVEIGEFKPKYKTEVAYDYSVAGTAYTGNRIRTSDGEWDDRDGAIQALGSLATGARVMVHYDPADPSQSLLQPGVGFQEVAILIAPLIMLGIGGSLLWLVTRDIFRRREWIPPPLPIPGGNAGWRN